MAGLYSGIEINPFLSMKKYRVMPSARRGKTSFMQQLFLFAGQHLDVYAQIPVRGEEIDISYIG